MEMDTLVLMVLTGLAFCWWVGLRVQEDRQYAKELIKQEEERAEREERVRLLYNKR